MIDGRLADSPRCPASRFSRGDLCYSETVSRGSPVEKERIALSRGRVRTIPLLADGCRVGMTVAREQVPRHQWNAYAIGVTGTGALLARFRPRSIGPSDASTVTVAPNCSIFKVEWYKNHGIVIVSICLWCGGISSRHSWRPRKVMFVKETSARVGEKNKITSQSQER